ncbi:MAG: FAD-binding protein [Gemmatimonadetes bacterium]|nr:FAD-binding protein [Gemmatimonadota bacterium]
MTPTSAGSHAPAGVSSLMRPSLNGSMVRALGDIVGREHVITERDRLVVYESDGLTAYRVSPQAVVLPGSTAEAAAVVKLLHDAGIPVVPRGAGTGLSGGALPIPEGVVVGTARMNEILEIDAVNRLARVQPGVINARLTEAARPHGLYYAPDPSSQSTCTLGGNVAENSGGPHCLKYGVTTRYVTGLKVVVAGGDVIQLGGAGRTAEGGLDLVGLFVGSEGCFGITTEIEVRLLPLAEGVRTLLGIFETMEAAGHAVTAIIASGLVPAAVEIVDNATIRAVEASVYAGGYPVDAGAALVIEFDGTEEGLDVDADAAEACCRAAGARDVKRATEATQRAKLWNGRKKAFGAMGRIAPDLLVQDATVPRTRLPEVLARITEIGERYRLRVANVFHAGDGNLHPNILFDRNDSDELERVERASKEIMKLCVDVGGTITGEHGVGVDKRRYMRLVHGPEEIAVMAAVKGVFDPRGLFNPGKVLPDPEPAHA